MTIKPGETQRNEFTMPNYVGSVRIMAVGSGGHSYASLEKTVPLRQPLMVLTTIPRVGRPGDVFAVPVSVFAMDPSIREVDLSISVKGALRIEGANVAKVTFDKPGERDYSFSVGVKNEIGSGTIVVSARAGSHETSDRVELPVTAPNPFYIKATDTTVLKEKPVRLVARKIGIEGTNSARVSFTRFPDIQIHKRFKDLIRYPYGCIEQTDNGRPITLEAIDQGDLFWIRYRVRSLTHERLDGLALSSLIPSGWEMINFRLEGTEPPEWTKNLSVSWGSYMDMRDDRVNWFFDLGNRGEADFLVKCNATFRGSYRLPPVTVEPMYSPDYFARIAGGAAVVR